MNISKFLKRYFITCNFLFYIIIYVIFSIFIFKKIIHLIKLNELVVFYTLSFLEIFFVALVLTFLFELIRSRYFYIFLTTISALLISVIFIIQGLSIFFSAELITVLALENYTEGRYIDLNFYVYTYIFLIIITYSIYCICQYNKLFKD